MSPVIQHWSYHQSISGKVSAATVARVFRARADSQAEFSLCTRIQGAAGVIVVTDQQLPEIDFSSIMPEILSEVVKEVLLVESCCIFFSS
ncbi:unnamed protein product [Sphagnum troendelagicum]|uniref:Uncharacterized protein n=1 Tax=Sphagnum troendelagicum TaxID=128251 RepID=A0ABP0UTJ2_9BRYO